MTAPRRRFQGVSQDVKSYLPSSPHSVEQRASSIPTTTFCPGGAVVWGRVFRDENVPCRLPVWRALLSAEGMSFLKLCEQGDQGRLPGGDSIWKVHGWLGAGLELVCSQPLDHDIAGDP